MRVHFGLGPATKVDSILVRWPNGLSERFDGTSVDSIQTVKEGTGTPVAAETKKP
jgi:hypothetical protein